MASASTPSGSRLNLNLSFLDDPDNSWSNPSEDQIARWIQDLRCFTADHGPCPAGCQRSEQALTGAGFLTPITGTDGQTELHFTADLVWALAHSEHRGLKIDWTKLNSTLLLHCNVRLPELSLQHLRDSAKEAFDRLARNRPQYRPGEHLDSQEEVEEMETPAVPPQPLASDGPQAGDTEEPPPRPPPIPAPSAGEITAAAIPSLVQAVAQLSAGLQQQSAQSAAQTSAALQKITEISSADRASMFAAAAQTEHIISTSVRFTGDTKSGNTEYLHFRDNFRRRADKLRWSNRDKCQNWCQAWEDKALRVLQAKMQTTRGIARRMFEDDWDALLRWSDEQYTLAGANYHINFKSVLEQRSKETFTDYTNRVTAVLTIFLDNHKEYFLEQMPVPPRFLEKGAVATKAGEVAWTGADDATIDARYASLHGPGRPSLDLLRRWAIEDRNTPAPGTRETAWDQIALTFLWTAICYPVLDGMRSTAARKDAYRKRDECFHKADLRTKAGQDKMDALKLFVCSKEAEADNLHTINNKNISKVNAAKGDGEAQINKINGQQQRRQKSRNRNNNNGNRKNRSNSRNGRGGRSNSRGRRGRIHEIDGEEQYESDGHTQNGGGRPNRGQVGAARGIRGGGRGRMPRPPISAGSDTPRNGDVYYGPDGLRRTYGAICGKCGARNHTSEDCAKGGPDPSMGAISAHRGERRGQTLAQVFADNS